MGNPYKIKLVKNENVETFVGEVDFIDPDNQPGSGGVAGAGPPLGAVVPTKVGEQYTDTNNGALWLSDGLTNTHWVQLGGPPEDVGNGIQSASGDDVSLFNGPAAVRVDNAGNIRATAGTGQEVQLGAPAGPGVRIGESGDNIELAFFGAVPVVQQTIVGALSDVTDVAAKAVLTSIIAALAGSSLVVDTTT